MNLPKIYQAQKYEDDIYKMWEDSGAFKPKKHAKEHFSIIMPPPNATGTLHVGHAAMLAIEDTLVRYRRMQGDSVLWLPGTDHAAIATNAILEKKLASEGKSKHDIGRKEFLKQLSEFVEESKDTIRKQIRAMGSSCDWSKERYTMEEAMNRVVGEVFIKMYEDGLVYRGHRMVNWDKNLQTVVSDDEVEYEEETTEFYTLKYGPFEIGTARPETKFGDKYVVMHPEDKRYSDYAHGQEIELEWINGNITATVIKDEAVDPEFGTGVMTITPWHDQVDFEIAERHNLDKQQIIDLEGKLMPVAKEFSGMDIEDARKKIVKKLDEKGLLVETKTDYVHKVARSDRGKAIIEPQIMEQWFVDVNKEVVKWQGKKKSLKQIMQEVVRDGEIDILPERFDKIYFNWVDNLRDWCISRQIWWGHRIPAWYKLTDEGHETKVGFDAPDDSGDWKQDPDTLDTWFSSGLWSWSTLIDPEVALNPKYDLKQMLKHSEDFKNFHPTSVLETGYDIIFFWVARMVLMTTYITEEIPFEKVYLHGLVRTQDGSKMSKSRPETIINPLDMIEKYGTDALRLSLLVGQAPGNDMRIFEDKIASYRNFCNKLWNIARYCEGTVEDIKKKPKVSLETAADHWIYSRAAQTITEVEKLMSDFEIGKAYEEIYHFIWDDFADWYIEFSKTIPNHAVLVDILEIVLKLAHPFAPFVTETIWDTFDWRKNMLISEEWPKVKAGKKREADEFKELQTLVREVRNLDTHLRLHDTNLYYTNSEFVDKYKDAILKLTPLKDIRKVVSGKGLHLTKSSVNAWLDVEMQRAEQYIKKLEEQRENVSAEIQQLKKRLDNKAYVSNAPKELVQESKEQLQEKSDLFDNLTNEINNFQNAMS